MDILNRETWEKYYESISQEYEYYYIQEQLIETVIRSLNNYVKGKKILELGCGKGLESIELAKKGAEVTVVEYSENAINAFKKRKGEININVIKNDISDVKFPENYFDLVFSSGVLEHFKNPDIIIKKQYEFLKNKGIIIVEVPNKCTLFTIFKKILMKLNKWPAGWETEYSPNELKNLLENNGFNIIDIIGRDFLVLRIFRKIKRKIGIKDKGEGVLYKWFRSKIQRNKIFLKYFFVVIAVVGEK